MRRLVLDWDSGITEEVFHLVSLGSTEGVVFHGLRELRWIANPYTLPFHRLLLSPRLTTLSLTYSTFGQPPKGGLSIIQPMVMGLDTSSLRDLRLHWWIPEASREMESAASSAVLRCGPALKNLSLSSPLSDAAVQHIMQLPNLDKWYTTIGPPKTLDLPTPHILPRIDHLSLASEASLEWLTFFTTTARCISSGQNPHTPPDRGPIQRLHGLTACLAVPIDALFMSPIMLFRELTFLRLASTCSIAEPRCGFSLTDGNVAEIVIALPRLKVASWGLTCFANSCQTTVASLVSFSTCCRDLERLEIHFNTTNLRNELESVSGDPRLDGLLSLRTHDSFYLSMTNAPYTTGKDDVVPVLKGFRRIFPSLTEITGNSTSWKELNRRLWEV
jgi:hypothetical protein